MPQRIHDHDHVYVQARRPDRDTDRTPADAIAVARAQTLPGWRDKGRYIVRGPEVYDGAVGPEYHVEHVMDDARPA